MFDFYLKLLIRQLRQPSIRLFCVAITMACAVTFSISLLGDRLEQLFNMQAKEVLAADLVLQSSSKVNQAQLEIIKSIELRTAKTLTFQTMANSDDSGKFLLSSVKAVSDAYPLLGELQITNQLYAEAKTTQAIPKINEAWVEDRILNELDLQLNEYINIGEKSFKVTQVLIYEPDRGNSFYSFTPRVLINWQAIDATKVVKPGSRVKFRYLFAGDQSQLSLLVEKLSSTLGLNQQFVTIGTANQTLTNTLDKAYRFLHITALIAVLLGAVAAALVSYHYANVMTHQYALLRCLGLQSKQMVAAVVIPFLLFTIIAIVVGFGIGAIAQIIILNTLGDLLPETLPAASIKPYVLTSLTAFIVVVSFAWPFLKKLLTTPPKLLLNDVGSQHGSIFYTVVFILIGLSLLVYIATQDTLISVYILAILFGFILIAYFTTRLFIGLFVKLSQQQAATMKLAIRNLSANHNKVAIQVIAVALTFFALALISTIRDDLVLSWQAKVPVSAPNIFVINLFENDKANFLGFLNSNQINHSPTYPIIRGRLSAVNNIDINQYASIESDRYDDALERDLALTWSTQLPKDNLIVNGAWHNDDSQTNSVSIEQDIADNLAINIGDMLTFTIQASTISAQVTSIRTVEWESFTPNFYMIFSPISLKDMPTTYMSSFYLNNQQRPLLRELVKLFPSATFFDVEFLLTRVRQVTEKVSFAVETVLYFALISSILVFISIEMILRQARAYSAAIFKAVGANTLLIQNVFRIEFILIGILSGVIAYMLNLVVSFSVANYILEGAFIFNIKTALLCLVLAPLLVFVAGYISIYRTKQKSVKSLLM